jgi:hypothetical protein
MQQSSLPTYQISERNLVYIVWVDEIIHTDETPFCSDVNGCPCHDDSNLVREYITRPLDLGMITNAEALRLYFGTQLTPIQDAPMITDEPLRISVQFQGMMDSLLIDHD